MLNFDNIILMNIVNDVNLEIDII